MGVACEAGQDSQRLQLLVEWGASSSTGGSTRIGFRAEIYPEVDAFVMPTHAEGFGFTNIEAMSFGLPVISSTVGPTRRSLVTTALACWWRRAPLTS